MERIHGHELFRLIYQIYVMIKISIRFENLTIN
jgi:hypothetical protein